MYKYNSCLVITYILVLIPFLSVARDSPFTRKGTGPQYWIAYEYCIETNMPITESRWKSNIDWIYDNFKAYGFDMICNDGWIEAAQTINENGYITKYNSDWENGFEYWAAYLSGKGLKMGVYYNPMWLTKAAYDRNVPVKGTDYTTQQIVGKTSFNEPLYWVDVNKPGAKEWIQGYVNYFKDMGTTYLRIDFLENYETNYGTNAYTRALQWIDEAAGDDLFISLVMPHCYNHAATELRYGDMIRIDDDCYEGDWNFVSNRRRGEQKNQWPQFGNAFDGFIGFSDISGHGQMILDGDFMRMNKLANDEERKFLYSIMIMGGSALAIADQFDTINGHGWIYQNHEVNELNRVGFIGKPISNNYKDSVNSSRWIGQLPDGDWIVGLFNREDVIQQRSIHFEKELGIQQESITKIRDLWEKQDVANFSSELSISLAPHSCKLFRIKHNSIKFEAETATTMQGAKKVN